MVDSAKPKLYNFYRRYPWTEGDFTGWQNGMVAYARGLHEGAYGAAVLKGFAVTLNGNMTLTAGSGIACGPTGNLLAVTEVSNVLSIAAPSATFERALVVVRPSLVNGDYITKPTDPNVSVPLTTAQEAALVVIRGTLSNSPSYPAAAANDTVLFGVRLASGQTSILESDLDFEVRDIPGKNSNFQQDAGKYDDRLRVSRHTATAIKIRPSQLELPLTRVFSYVNRRSPSIYPKTAGGLYAGTDTYLDLTTGLITGGDAASAAITPTIPAAGTWINATVSITTLDTLAVSYGTAGTRAQCYAGVKNQLASGAGSVAFPLNAKPIAFLMLGSQSGAAITEIDIFDARGMIGAGDYSTGLGAGGPYAPAIGLFPLTLTSDMDGKFLLVPTRTAAVQVNLPTPTAGYKVTVIDSSGQAALYPITFHRFAAESIHGRAADYVGEADYGSWTLEADGTNWWLIP